MITWPVEETEHYNQVYHIACGLNGYTGNPYFYCEEKELDKMGRINYTCLMEQLICNEIFGVLK